MDDIRYRNFYQGNDPNRKRRVSIHAPNDFQGLHEASQATSNTKTACLFNESGANVHSMIVSIPSEDNPDEHIYLSKVGESALYSHQLNAMKNYYELIHNSTLTVKYYDKICLDESTDIPIGSKSWLSHNYPNPFNPTTTISYNLKVGVNCPKIRIYNVKGQLVRTLNLLEQPGENKIIWDGTNNNNKPVSSGTYFYSLYEGNKEINTSKMLLIK